MKLVRDMNKPKKVGQLFKIIGGNYKDKYCIVFQEEQIEHYLKIKRLFVRYFEDAAFKIPTLLNDKKMCGLEYEIDLKHIGFTD